MYIQTIKVFTDIFKLARITFCYTVIIFKNEDLMVDENVLALELYYHRQFCLFIYTSDRQRSIL